MYSPTDLDHPILDKFGQTIGEADYYLSLFFVGLPLKSKLGFSLCRSGGVER